MIVRDNETTIRDCLSGIRKWVDEMIVVDTGSVDNTPSICDELGAKVSTFPWRDDFAAARNESIRRATGEWIFWMDSDDTITEENGRKLRETVYRDHPETVLGYVMQVHCPGRNREDLYDTTIVDHVKLFRNHPLIQFEGRIHEQVLMPIRRLGGEIGWTDIFVSHSGADQSSSGLQRKYERDLRILMLDHKDRPQHPFVLFNLGMTYNDMQKHERAVHWLERCVVVSQPGESHLAKAYAILVHSLCELRNYRKSLAACEQAKQLFPDDPELLFREAIVLSQMGRFEDAIETYNLLLQQNGTEKRGFRSTRNGISSFLARHNLAVLHRNLGEWETAEVHWRSILDECPDYKPAIYGIEELGSLSVSS